MLNLGLLGGDVELGAVGGDPDPSFNALSVIMEDGSSDGSSWRGHSHRQNERFG